MTTIAYDVDAGHIATDSQETSGNGEKYNCKKLFEVNGYIIATAGGSYAGMAFVNWMANWHGDPDWSDHPDFVNLDTDEDFECLIISPDGECFTVNRLLTPLPQKGNKLITLGSGSKAARGAMMAGATAKEAVEIAKKIDSYTGGRIQEVILK